MSFEIITALITPFYDENKIDYLSLKRIINDQLSFNINKLLLFATTGEGSLISLKEKIKVIKKLNKDFNNLHLIVGIHSNNLQDIKRQISSFKKEHVEGFLLSPPDYYILSDNAIYEYYLKISRLSNVPIIIYNIPKRTGNIITSNLLSKLREIPNIVGIKEASNSISFIKDIIKYQDDNFKIYLGDDKYLISGLNLKLDGLFSVASNIIPEKMKKIVTLYSNDYLIADKQFEEIKKYLNLIFIEPNPIPIKYIMSKKYQFEELYLFPLNRLSLVNKKIIDKKQW